MYIVVGLCSAGSKHAELHCYSTVRILSTLIVALILQQSHRMNATLQSPTGAHKRFEYKLSFKGPHLVQRDGTVPFWEHFGHAIASDESIRITPSLKSKKGQVWSKESNPHEHWEIEVVFRISGRGRIGADGLAIWYTTDRGVEGPVFGSADKWNGLGVFFDSFDNDALQNNPYIMAIVNDGTLNYQHETDGSTQQVGGCLRDFRNKPFPVRARIEYYKNALTVSIHNGLTNNREDFELCMRVEGVSLPRNGFFGITAATGGLADDHDVLAFLTHSLTPSTEMPTPGQQVPDDERKRYEDEFNEYRQKLDKAKDEYRKDHPVQPGGAEIYEGEEDKLYEGQEMRELNMIFQGQNEMHRVMKLLLGKLDEIIGRQERQLSMLSLISQPGQAAGQLPHVGGPIQRHEVDTLLNTQKDVANQIRELRSVINEVQSRASVAPSSELQELRNHLNSIQSDVRTLASKPQAQLSCPPPQSGNSVTPFYLVALLVGQLACIIGYMMYRSTKEAAAKKFY